MKLSKSELDAVVAASTRTFVPFNKLVLSASRQARPDDGQGAMSLPELAASIHAAGLLHNLVVVRGAKGAHEVCAGGRRWRAMALLVADGRWPGNQPVPVLVVPAEQALMASLIENVQREAMHPVDEFAAFARLVADGRSVEDVAAAFGVTPLVVKRRLKLAGVSPRLLDEYRAGRIDLACLMLLAGIDDPARQEALWSQLPEWGRDADQLRRLIARVEVESDCDSVARFVTVERYEAAGGKLRRDLFSEDGGKAWLLDAALLDRLAIEGLQGMARELQSEGWLWVDVRARYAHDDYARHGEVRRTRRSPTDAEAAQLASLLECLDAVEARMDALADLDGDDEEAYTALEAEADALQARQRALEDQMTTYAPEWKTCAGCVVFVGAQGSAEVKRGLIRPEDRKAIEAVRRGASEAKGDASAPLVSEPRAAVRPVHSERLMKRLTAHRVAALQAELMDRPDVALAAITAHLAAELLQGGLYSPREGPEALRLRAGDAHACLRQEAEDVAAAASWTAMEVARAEWERLLPEAGEQLLPWVLGQDAATVQRLLAFLVSCTVTGVEGVERECRATDPLARALELDMRRWWAATADGYLSQVSRAHILEVVTEVAGANAAAGMANLKKAELVAAAERRLSGQGWLPKCLQTHSEVGC